MRTTVKHPETWKEDFLRQAMRTTFTLHLSQAMIEFICAVSENCRWDRGRSHNLHVPDNWIATETSLEKRGLIRRKTGEAYLANLKDFKQAYPDANEFHDGPSFCELTPAGEKLVELFKTVGLFVATEANTNRRKHKARRAQ